MITIHHLHSMRTVVCIISAVIASVLHAQQPSFIWVEGHYNPDGSFTAGAWVIPQGPGNPYIIIEDNHAFSRASMNWGALASRPQLQLTPRYTPEERAAMRSERQYKARLRRAAAHNRYIRLQQERERKKAARKAAKEAKR